MGDQDAPAMPAKDLLEYDVIAYPGTDLPQNYHGLIHAKWVSSLRHGNDWFKSIDPPACFTAMHRIITHVLSLPDCVVRLAVLPDDHDVVLGFSVCRTKILDYVHVLRIRLETPEGIAITSYRQRGIARALVPDDVQVFTHLTKAARNIWPRKFGHLKFNPFM